MKQFIQSLLLGFLAVMLSGCPGGSDSDNDGPSFTGNVKNSGTNESTGTSSGTDDPSSEPRVVKIGALTGTSFTEGSVKSNKTTIKAGETADLSVSLIDGKGNLVTDNVEVVFNSTCVADGLAEFENATINNVTGTIRTKYTPVGCDGKDTITATTNVLTSGGQTVTITANTTIDAVPAEIGSITFVSATPTLIGLKGSGSIPEQSDVIFKVTNVAGGPVQNQVVDFELNPETGGITLSNLQGITAADGTVKTVVSAGEVATTVRVKATATRNGKTTSANSSSLAISTGIPDQDSFSLSVETPNIEGWDIDGTTTTVTIRAADRYNNPVADGTSVNFITEGGSIGSNCITTGGACTVTFTSQEFRPQLDGRATVLAHAVGEETFVDSNPSNGRFDDAETWDDLDEAYLDKNENGSRDSDEPYIDHNSNNAYDLVDGLFNGLLCNGPRCGTNQAQTLTISDQIVVILSGSSINIGANPASINLDGGPVTVQISLQDDRGQVPAAGSAINVATTQGTLLIDPSGAMPKTDGVGPFVIAAQIEPGNAAGNGALTVSIESPSGVVSNASFPITQTVVP